MRNLQDLIKSRSVQLSTTNRSSFNTNDYLLEILMNKKIDRQEVIDMLVIKRAELKGFDMAQNTDDLSDDELNEVIATIDKLYKTSKNGLDTSVSDSNNNSSFSYNDKYKDYKLIKEGSSLKIVKIKDAK